MRIQCSHSLTSDLCSQIMCRCTTALENSVKEKISMFCHVEPEQVKAPTPPPDRPRPLS